MTDEDPPHEGVHPGGEEADEEADEEDDNNKMPELITRGEEDNDSDDDEEEEVEVEVEILRKEDPWRDRHQSGQTTAAVAPFSEIATVAGNGTNTSNVTQEEAEYLLKDPKVNRLLKQN